MGEVTLSKVYRYVGMVFTLFRSENGYGLRLFSCLEWDIVFERTTGVYERIGNFNPK